MTRAEYIRNIPIKELAQIIIDKNITDEYCKSDCGSNGCPHEKDCCIRWLNEDVGEGICPEFEKGKPPKETEKESEGEEG